MSKFLRTVIVDARTMATEVKSFDLPINPLSFIKITLEGTALTTIPTLTEILAFINKVEITHRGQSIISLDGEDLAALNLYLLGSRGFKIADLYATSTYFSYSFFVPFGRRLYDENECYPGTRKGELQITLDTTIPATSFNVAVMSLEACELPDASPSQYLKATQLNVSAPGATGIFDTQLPLGNELLAILIGLAAFPTSGDVLYTVDDMRLLCDNVEHQFASAKTPALIADRMLRSSRDPDNPVLFTLGAPDYYLWMDFDPNRDSAFSVQTSEFSEAKCRFNYGENAAIHVIPVEIVQV